MQYLFILIFHAQHFAILRNICSSNMCLLTENLCTYIFSAALLSNKVRRAQLTTSIQIPTTCCMRSAVHFVIELFFLLNFCEHLRHKVNN